MALSCSSIKIETGQTTEEATESSAEQASRMRSEWADFISRTPQSKRPEQMREIVRRAMATYQNFGRQILNLWEEGEKGRGEKVSAEEIRERLDGWLAPQQPVLKAYDDMFEYTYDQLKKEFPDNYDLLNGAKKLSKFYYNAYPAFFYPTETVDEYRYDLEAISNETDKALDDFSQIMPN